MRPNLAIPVLLLATHPGYAYTQADTHTDVDRVGRAFRGAARAHRVRFALVVHPFTGEPEVWRLGDDNSEAHPVDPARFVHRTWEVMT